jgi:hypothetical protein
MNILPPFAWSQLDPECRDTTFIPQIGKHPSDCTVSHLYVSYFSLDDWFTELKKSLAYCHEILQGCWNAEHNTATFMWLSLSGRIVKTMLSALSVQFMRGYTFCQKDFQASGKLLNCIKHCRTQSEVAVMFSELNYNYYYFYMKWMKTFVPFGKEIEANRFFCATANRNRYLALYACTRMYVCMCVYKV